MTAPGMVRPWLSVVMPFYRKLAEFERVVALNAPFWSRPGIEVVIALDDAADEAGLQRLLARFPEVCWTLLVNDRAHAWRPPGCAINAGVRHSTGRFVFVHSPESAYVGDAPAMALQAAMQGAQGVGVGRVGFAQFDALDALDAAMKPDPHAAPAALAALFAQAVPDALYLSTFYGSLCCAREAFDAVGGYDESLAQWGGDDDNFRVRLEMAGWQLQACGELKLLHLSFEARDGSEQFDPDNDWARCTPAVARANEADGERSERGETPAGQGRAWGFDFTRIARKDTALPQPTRNAVPAATPETLPSWLRPARAFAMGSRLQCEICARMVHHEPVPHFHCPRCSKAAPQRLTARPRIVCVMQLRNEARLLEGCLAHLRPYVDGFVLLDDGSTDDTARIARREPQLLELLSNPPAQPHAQPHAWNERENRRRLLESARAHGAGWVLVCDADERYETLFLANLHAIVDSLSEAQLSCLSLALRELWDAPDRFRVDGPWGRKSRACLFRLPQEIGFAQASALHGPWYPDAVARHGVMYRSYYRLYHLKMIRREDRIARRDLYKRLDPEARFQPMGYDYLAEEGPALRLEAVAPERGYALASLPPELATLLQDDPEDAPADGPEDAPAGGPADAPTDGPVDGPADATSERAKSPR